jgi:hypothetical protein
MAQPHGRARTVAKLSNYLIAVLNDCAHSHRIIGVAIVEGQSLLLHVLGGSITSNPVEGNSRGGSGATGL